MKFAATTLPLLAVVTQGVNLEQDYSNVDLDQLKEKLQELLVIDTEIAEKCEEGECCDGDDCSVDSCDGDDCSEGSCEGDECLQDAQEEFYDDILADISTKLTQVDIPEALEEHTIAMALDFDRKKITFM